MFISYFTSCRCVRRPGRWNLWSVKTFLKWVIAVVKYFQQSSRIFSCQIFSSEGESILIFQCFVFSISVITCPKGPYLSPIPNLFRINYPKAKETRQVAKPLRPFWNFCPAALWIPDMETPWRWFIALNIFIITINLTVFEAHPLLF